MKLMLETASGSSGTITVTRFTPGNLAKARNLIGTGEDGDAVDRSLGAEEHLGVKLTTCEALDQRALC